MHLLRGIDQDPIRQAIVRHCLALFTELQITRWRKGRDPRRDGLPAGDGRQPDAGLSVCPPGFETLPRWISPACERRWPSPLVGVHSGKAGREAARRISTGGRQKALDRATPWARMDCHPCNHRSDRGHHGAGFRIPLLRSFTALLLAFQVWGRKAGQHHTGELP